MGVGCLSNSIQGWRTQVSAVTGDVCGKCVCRLRLVM